MSKDVEINGRVYSIPYLQTGNAVLHTDGVAGPHLTKDEMDAIHNIVGQMSPCSDENCLCFEAGHQSARERNR